MLHTQSAILLHPNLRRLTDKNKFVSHKIGSCMVKIVPIPRPSPCLWASAARRGWWTRTRAGRADPRSGRWAAVWERPAPAPWTTVYSFYSINLSNPLTITHKTATDLMEEGGWSWRMRKNNEIEEIQRGKSEAGVCFLSLPQCAIHNMADIKNSSADCVLPSSLTNFRERATQPFPHGSCTRARSRNMYVWNYFIKVHFIFTIQTTHIHLCQML